LRAGSLTFSKHDFQLQRAIQHIIAAIQFGSL
jgi:hypothetical protein